MVFRRFAGDFGLASSQKIVEEKLTRFVASGKVIIAFAGAGM